MIQVKRPCQLSNNDMVVETSRAEEEQVDAIDFGNLVVEEGYHLEEPRLVTEDRNEVMAMEVVENAIQDEEQGLIVKIDQQRKKDEVGKEEMNGSIEETKFPVDDQIKAVIGQKVGVFEERNGKHVKKKGESLERRRSGRKQKDFSEEENISGEQHKVGAKEQYHPRKQYNVMWIGRREHAKEKGEHVEQRQSGKQQASKEQNQRCERNGEGIEKQGQRKQYNVMWIGRGVRKLKEAGRDLQKEDNDELVELEDNVVSEEKDAMMIDSDAKEDENIGGVEERKGKQKQVKGASKEQVSQLQQNDPCREQVDLQQQSKEEADDKLHRCGQQRAGNMKQEVESTNEEDSVIMQCAAQVRAVSVNEQHDDIVEEQIQPREQPTRGIKEEFQPHGKQQRQNDDKEALEKQVEIIGEPHLSEEQQREKIEKEKVLMEEDTEAPQDAVMIPSEAQVRGADLEPNELENLHNYVIEEQDKPLEQNRGITQARGASVEQDESEEHRDYVTCEKLQPQKFMEGAEEKFQPSGLQRRGKSVNKTLGKQVEPPQHEEQSETINKEMVLMDEDAEEPQDAVLVQSKAQVSGASLELIGMKEQHDDVTEELVHPQEKCVEGAKENFQPCGKGQLKIESAEERLQQEEQHTEVNQKDIGLTDGVSDVQPDTAVLQTEAQVEGDSVEHYKSEVQEDDATVEQVQLQEVFVKGTKEESQAIKELNGQQKDENEGGLKECENGVKVQACQPPEQYFEEFKEKKQPDMQKEEENPLQEKSNVVNTERSGSVNSIIKSSRAFPSDSPGVEKMCLPEPKNQDEQRRPLRQGLRSRCKKEEATPNAEVGPTQPRSRSKKEEATPNTEVSPTQPRSRSKKEEATLNAENQPEQVTPVRRSLRSRKTNSEAAAMTEASYATKGLDSSKEQPKQSGRERPPKRKSKNSAAEHASKSQKTARTDL